MKVPISEIWQVVKLTNIRSRVLPLICVGSVANCSNPCLMRKFNIRTESDEWLWYVSQFTSGMLKSPQITVGRLLFWLITCERKLMISIAALRNLLEKRGLLMQISNRSWQQVCNFVAQPKSTVESIWSVYIVFW